MRAVACLVLSAIPVYLGFSLASATLLRVRTLSAILELLSHIRYEIASFRTAQRELFLSFESAPLFECGFLQALQSTARLGAENVLWSTLQESGHLLEIGREDRRLLEDYARHLGEFDAAEEVERAERVRALLAESLAAQKAEAGKSAQILRAFGLALGLFVWLMFI